MKTRARAGLCLLLLAGFALRLYRLGAASLWYDETVSLYLARQDLVALTRHTAGDIHPPLYYYLLHLWGAFAGWSEFSAAFLSLFFGVLLIALVYRAAREWLGKRVALVAALLVTLSPFNLWYSQEVRMYTLGAALGLVSVFFFVRMLGRRGSRRDFAAYAVASALGLYTLYYFAFLIVFENVYALLLLVRRKSKIPNPKSQIQTWVLSQVAILVLYLPWAPIAFRQATDPPVPPWRSFSPLWDVLTESFSALTLGPSVDRVIAAPILVLVALVIIVGLWTRQGKQEGEVGESLTRPYARPYARPYVRLLLVGYTVVPLLLIYGLSFWKPLYHVRYMFIYSPGFYVLIALGLVRVYEYGRSATLGIASRPRSGTRGGQPLAMAQSRSVAMTRSQPLGMTRGRVAFYAVVLLLIAGSAYSAFNFWFNPAYADDDLRGAVQHLDDMWRPGDAVLIDAGYTYTAFDYYNTLPIAWQGRLKNYAPGEVSALAVAKNGAVVLETGSIGGAPSLGWNNPESDFYPTTADETRAALDRVFAAHSRVWLLRLYDTVVDPQGVVRDYLATRGRIFEDEGYAGSSYPRVQGYLTPQATLERLPAAAVSYQVVWGNRIVLLGYAPAATTLHAGTPLDMDIYWQAREPTNIDEHLYIGLYTSDGKPVASNSEVPLGNGLGTSRWNPGEVLVEPVRLKIPESLAAGEYVLRVALYDPLTNEPLPAQASEGLTKDGQVTLTRVTIGR